MRTDKKLPGRGSDDWKFDFRTGGENREIVGRLGSGGQDADDAHHRHSFSGKERNHLFLNTGGKQFTDISMISGLDNIGDGRGFVLLDYDRDGWQDIALVGANHPLLSLYHNRIARASEAADKDRPRMIALRFVGGNHEAKPSEKLSPREGYGSVATVALGKMTLTREHRCGEGFATQNSATMLIGIGARSVADSVQVRWPSGKTHTIRGVAAGTLLTAYENTVDSPDGRAFTSTTYRLPRRDRPIQGDSTPGVSADRLTLPGVSGEAKLRMHTTMATWCRACKRELPQLARLRDRFDPKLLAMYGVPIDPIDSHQQLQFYLQQHSPAYKLLLEVSVPQRENVARILRARIQSEALPATIITDAHGNVLATLSGVPTVSEIGRLINEVNSAPGPTVPER